ncbi:MAG: nucleotidyltransferase family protein [Bacteroidia bacterium]|nr:nucleotidyltransferase family protein [Bacteroidia bacterium]
MKAMIFAAGLGTRLSPLTDHKPKALIEINGKTLLELTVNKLIGYGFTNIIINVHHFADQIRNYLSIRNNFGIHIEISDESSQLLDTGGGLKKAAGFFSDGKPFLAYNVDIFSDIDLNGLYRYHASGSLVSLAVMERQSSRYFLFDDHLQLCGWKNTTTGEVRMSTQETKELRAFAFSGIQVIDPAIFPLIIEDGVFSLTGLYLRLAETRTIRAFVHNNNTFIDLGKPDSLIKAEEIMIKKI